MAEQGFAEAQVTPWFGIVLPAGDAAAAGRAHQHGTGGGAGDGARSAKSSMSPDASQKARRFPSSAT